MFDPQIYFGSLEKEIDDYWNWAQTSGPGPLYPIVKFDRLGRWVEILWRFEVVFPSGQKIIAFESHFRDDHNKHYRKIKYRLMQTSGELIFQVDTHSEPIPFEEPPHLHIGPGEKRRVLEGDPILGENSLQGFDFPRMMNWVQDYLSDGRVPWRQ